MGSLFICFQTATSFKTFIDNWNIQTAVWLKTSVLSLLSRPQISFRFLTVSVCPSQGVLRPSPPAQAGADLHPVGPVARCLPRVLFHLHHRHPHHHRSTGSKCTLKLNRLLQSSLRMC